MEDAARGVGEEGEPSPASEKDRPWLDPTVARPPPPPRAEREVDETPVRGEEEGRGRVRVTSEGEASARMAGERGGDPGRRKTQTPESETGREAHARVASRVSFFLSGSYLRVIHSTAVTRSGVRGSWRCRSVGEVRSQLPPVPGPSLAATSQTDPSVRSVQLECGLVGLRVALQAAMSAARRLLQRPNDATRPLLVGTRHSQDRTTRTNGENNGNTRIRISFTFYGVASPPSSFRLEFETLSKV